THNPGDEAVGRGPDTAGAVAPDRTFLIDDFDEGDDVGLVLRGHDSIGKSRHLLRARQHRLINVAGSYFLTCRRKPTVRSNSPVPTWKSTAAAPTPTSDGP